ncbi:MAG: hypothetical protein A2521_03330 [Deltaproteobacteria bacterium RIFOXYD12_FULL_57_12]|nr:MAG: hypothetical protein A2521_03330 [Deltaproteobacteria bacterium RIFOXYD12_FULL_57_12]
MAERTGFRLIPPLETYPWLVAFSQGLPGRVLLLAVFSVGLYFHTANWLPVSVFLAVLTLLPQYRPVLLVVATLGSLALADWPPLSMLRSIMPPDYVPGPLLKPLVIAVALAIFALCYQAVRENPDRWYGRRPVRTLLVFYVLLIVVAAEAPLSGLPALYLWTFLVVLGKYLWYFNYALLDRQARDTSPLALQVGHFVPFWGGSNTPFPKGAAYLRRIVAKDPEQLARCQLKGIKLLYWALLLGLVERVLRQILHGSGDALWGISFSLDIPSFTAVLHDIAGTQYPWHANWLALVTNFFLNLLGLSIWGHGIIACCRMAGYNALRNTCRPLQATSIADFWNRYYYYFKELLVEIFFYPAFLRHFKKRPKLRLFFATMAAACFGNILYHFLRDLEYIVELGLWPAVLSFQVYLFYGLVLGTAIGISQLFEKKSARNLSWFWKNVVNPGYIVGFYCLLSIFDDPDRSLTIKYNFLFLLRLFNINLS